MLRRKKTEAEAIRAWTFTHGKPGARSREETLSLHDPSARPREAELAGYEACALKFWNNKVSDSSKVLKIEGREEDNT